MLTNNTTIYILKDVYLDYDHQIDFDNLEAQYNFFMSKPKLSFTEGFQYIRTNNQIKLPKSYDDLFGYNYLMYKNKGKWYYCFIDGKDFISDQVTSITIRTDIIQTYMFDYSLEQSFVDREHQDRWIRPIPDIDPSMILPIYNDVQENLNYGNEYNIKSTKELHQDQIKTITDGGVKLGWFLIVSIKKLTEFGSSYNPVFRTPTPFALYLIPYDINDPDREFKISSPYLSDGGYGYSVDIHQFLNYWATTDDILSISFLPYLPLEFTASFDTEGNVIIDSGELILAKIRSGGTDESPTYSNDKLSYINANVTDYSSFFTKITSIAITEYVSPSNLVFAPEQPNNINYETKLKTYPYYFLSLTNYQTNPLLLKMEYLPSTILNVRYVQNLGGIIKSKFYVDGYLGDHTGKEQSVINSTVNDLPLKTNAYKQYMMNNKASATTGVALNVGGQLAGAGVAMAGAALTATGAGAPIGIPMMLAGAGGAVGAATTIGKELVKQQDLKNQPDNVRNQGNNIDFDITDGNLYLKLVEHEITDNFKHIIRTYFMNYGYKCSTFKKPNLKSRYYFNYIKTVGANVKGNIDNIILNQLRQIYDNGITFWHYREESTFLFRDYQYENIEVSMIS